MKGCDRKASGSMFIFWAIRSAPRMSILCLSWRRSGCHEGCGGSNASLAGCGLLQLGMLCLRCTCGWSCPLYFSVLAIEVNVSMMVSGKSRTNLYFLHVVLSTPTGCELRSHLVMVAKAKLLSTTLWLRSVKNETLRGCRLYPM